MRQIYIAFLFSFFSKHCWACLATNKLQRPSAENILYILIMFMHLSIISDSLKGKGKKEYRRARTKAKVAIVSFLLSRALYVPGRLSSHFPFPFNLMPLKLISDNLHITLQLNPLPLAYIVSNACHLLNFL